MASEFERIMEFFNLEGPEKEKRLPAVFEDAVAYFERFKHIMLTGKPEEKKVALERVSLIRRKMKEETERICKKHNLTEEELSAYSADPKNFSKDQWEMMSEAKTKLSEGMERLKGPKGEKEPQTQEKASAEAAKVKKKKKTPKGWIPS
jgi:hypothetical protein